MYDNYATDTLVTTFVAFVPEMSADAPKRNLVVALTYTLLLWVTCARLLSALAAL
jgi:hypothetical protein